MSGLDDLREQEAREQARRNGTGSQAAPSTALAESRVNLFDLIRDGVPEREFLPGTANAFAKAKRHLIVGESKAGKTLSIAVVLAIDVVLAGGVVVILDRENGAEEYSRRLGAVLEGRKADDDVRELIERDYHYHAWPQLRLEWRSSPEYPAAFEDADLVLFDNSRKFLSSLNLNEDSSDDFTKFVEALIDPLMNAGIATVILDNSGYSAPNRSRGTSAKPDFGDVIFSLKTATPFSLLQTGQTEMTVTHSRIGEIAGKWTLELGGGAYGSWLHHEAVEQRRPRPTRVMQKISEALEQDSPLSTRKLRDLSEAKASTTDEAIEILVVEGFVSKTQNGFGKSTDYSSLKPYRGSREGQS